MINIEEVLNCPLTSQEIYDMINSCLEEAEDNGFLNQFVFERALVCHEVLLKEVYKNLENLLFIQCLIIIINHILKFMILI